MCSSDLFEGVGHVSPEVRGMVQALMAQIRKPGQLGVPSEPRGEAPPTPSPSPPGRGGTEATTPTPGTAGPPPPVPQVGTERGATATGEAKGAGRERSRSPKGTDDADL